MQFSWSGAVPVKASVVDYSLAGISTGTPGVVTVADYSSEGRGTDRLGSVADLAVRALGGEGG